jgi:hypothetical protein
MPHRQPAEQIADDIPAQWNRVVFGKLCEWADTATPFDRSRVML